MTTQIQGSFELNEPRLTALAGSRGALILAPQVEETHS
jgi:hypothetical protein